MAACAFLGSMRQQPRADVEAGCDRVMTWHHHHHHHLTEDPTTRPTPRSFFACVPHKKRVASTVSDEPSASTNRHNQHTAAHRHNQHTTTQITSHNHRSVGFYLCPKRSHKEALSPTPTRTNRGKESRCKPEEGQRAGTADHAPQRDKQSHNHAITQSHVKATQSRGHNTDPRRPPGEWPQSE